jgi:integrase
VGTYDGGNPAAGVRPLRESPGRIRFLEHEEEQNLLAAAGEPLRTMVLVGIYAGLRLLSEALTLRWPDVDLKRGLLTVQAAYAKSGKTRTVPLNRILRAALATLRQKAPEGVAHRDGSLYRSIRTTFHTACRRAGLKDVSPHVLRHTFASRLAMAGVDPRTIQELGGWASLEMVERYTHLSPTHKAEAVERLVLNPVLNSPTVFTPPEKSRIMTVRKPLKSHRAPVAQVDRAAVS